MKLRARYLSKTFTGVPFVLLSTTILATGKGLSAYAVAGFEPELVFDFENELYRTGGSTSTFSDSITYASSGNKLMHDGIALKWAAHNLLTYSEDFSETAWAKNSVTETQIDGEVWQLDEGTATDVHRVTQQAFSTTEGFGHEIDVKAGNAAPWVRLTSRNNFATNFLDFNLADESQVTDAQVGTGAEMFDPVFTATPLEDGWYRLSVKCSGVNDTIAGRPLTLCILDDSRNLSYTGTNRTILIRRPCVFKNTLGGMAAVPADAQAVSGADTYVPTTSSAVYLPRRGHHVYNGSEWVNEGLLVESEARTNLLTYSLPDNTNWTKSRISVSENVSGQVSPDGTETVSKLVEDATPGARSAYLSPTVTGSHAASVWVKSAGESRLLRFQIGTSDNYFDPDTGLWGTTGAGCTNHAVEDWGNGWYRVSLTYDGSAATDFFALGLAETDAVNSYTGDGSSGVYVWHGQFEAGSTPSSLMVTNGSTVTRAAESLTVPAAKLPWPTPNVIGPELVTNGTFDTDSDWTLGTGWSIAGGELVATAVTSFSEAKQSLGIVVGKVYLLSLNATVTSGSFKVNLGGLGTSNTEITVATTGSYSRVIVGTSTAQITCWSNSSFTGSIDNISVREIDPLALSIQMQGKMTYADTDKPASAGGGEGEAVYYLWKTNTSNYLEGVLSTTGSISGTNLFAQSASGTRDRVFDADPYSPGINVPYNIASRHGSTFINGAVDGTALTADTTPTALPDLETTDLDLAYDYMGTVKLYRMWADDIGDSGIEEASS